MEVDIKLEGFKELMEQFDAFCSPALQIKIVQNAVKEGIKPVKADAERRLGRGKGYIATGTPKRRGWGADTVASIGIGLTKKHWPLVFREYGTIERVTKKGYKRGKITAQPFMRPALDGQRNNVLDRMKQYLEITLKALFEYKQKSIPEVKD